MINKVPNSAGFWQCNLVRNSFLQSEVCLPITSPAPIRMPHIPMKLLESLPQCPILPTQVPNTPLKKVNSKPANETE